MLKPLTYMEHGYSPATTRRGIALSRLLGEANPFPLIRIPWDRDNPWQAVFLHEVAHNLQADLGLWQENRTPWSGAWRPDAGTRWSAASTDAGTRRSSPISPPCCSADRPRPGACWTSSPIRSSDPDLPARRRPSHRLSARADPRRDVGPHGLRCRGRTGARGLATLYRLPRTHRIPPVLLSSADGVIPPSSTRSPSRPGAGWRSGRSRTSSSSAARRRARHPRRRGAG
jgi:hypothetical protein